MIDWTFPIVLITPNTQEHWTKRHRRNKVIYQIISRKWNIYKPKIELPCTIILTRLGPRAWDDDNHVYSQKSVRDTIVQLILPGKARGQGDNNPLITWVYKQEKSKVKQIRIQIIPTDCPQQPHK